MSDMRLLSVVPMSEFREPKIKVCKVDIKMLLENFCGGPSCLFHVLLRRHRQHEVSMSASFKVRRHGRRIPTYQLMYLNQTFSYRFSANLWEDGRHEICKESLDSVCYPAILYRTLVGLDGGLFTWGNSSNLLKSRCRPAQHH